MFFKKRVYVPIGTSCSVASYLRYVGLRNEAFPFDWNVVPIQNSIELINNKFNNFLKEENLVFLNPTNRLLFKENGIDIEVTKEIITPVYDKKYHILFVHDFSEQGYNELSFVRSKYVKRINRLELLFEEKRDILTLVYDNCMPNQWQNNLYNSVNYNFQILNENELQNLRERLNIRIISLDELKKTTFFIRFMKSIKNRIGKYVNFKKN